MKERRKKRSAVNKCQDNQEIAILSVQLRLPVLPVSAITIIISPGTNRKRQKANCSGCLKSSSAATTYSAAPSVRRSVALTLVLLDV